MTMEGWIKLHRQLRDSQVFSNPKLLKVWIWCLLKASVRSYDAIIGLRTVHIDEGQFVFGLISASEELDIPVRSLRRYLDVLQSEGMVAIKSTTKYSILTVENWGFYQGTATDKESAMASKRQANANIQEGKESINKGHFGEFKNVLLSEEELNKLKIRFPDDYSDRVERLSEYMTSSGRKYKSHYATILAWARKDAHDSKKGDDIIDW